MPHRTKSPVILAVVGRFTVLALACLLTSAPSASPALAQNAKVVPNSTSVDGPGRGDLAGFVATPQSEAGPNRAFLIAPNGLWFLATSPRAPGARLIDIKNGITLRFFTKQGLEIAGLSISPDSKTVFAQGYDGQIVGWDAETGQLTSNAAPTKLHDIKWLSLSYNDNDAESKAARDDLLSRYHLQSHFPELKSDQITINPTQEYAIVGYVGDPNWQGFQIWNLKKERREVFFRLEGDHCGGDLIAFDYDGKHLIYGNSGGESDPAHLDFLVFDIGYYGPDVGPKTASATLRLGGRCGPPRGDVDFAVSPDARFLIRSNGYPVRDEWIAWDLRSGKKAASIQTEDGQGAISLDGSTFAVLNGMQNGRMQPKRLMTVLRNGRRRSFEIPLSTEANSLGLPVLSANGKWVASKNGDDVAVWNTDGGRNIRKYRVGNIGDDTLWVSNSGDPLLLDQREGTAFAKGKWQSARTDPGSIIVQLTPNFRPQCGVLFCDRIVPELGVVERKRVDHRNSELIGNNLSADGRYAIARLHYTEKGIKKGTDILDVSDGRVVLHIDDDNVRFTPDSRFIVVRDFANSFVKYDLATGKRVWTTIPNWDQDGFQMFLADGRVRYSPSKYRNFRLVRGFEIRPFDAAAAKAFVALPDH
jgi:WD40 repeat protein